jgi:pyridoxine/pyridoxamine 5'-phosphate oxidase
MSDTADLRSVLMEIVGANRFMTLATADEHGVPWATPVWYATADQQEFFWVSSPQARHSRNISLRPEAAIVIFDSRQAPLTGQAVYLSATASEVADAERDRALAIFAGASRAQDLPIWNRADVESPARHRLYHATAVEHFVLSSTDERLRVQLS